MRAYYSLCVVKCGSLLDENRKSMLSARLLKTKLFYKLLKMTLLFKLCLQYSWYVELCLLNNKKVEGQLSG